MATLSSPRFVRKTSMNAGMEDGEIPSQIKWMSEDSPVQKDCSSTNGQQSLNFSRFERNDVMRNDSDWSRKRSRPLHPDSPDRLGGSSQRPRYDRYDSSRGPRDSRQVPAGGGVSHQGDSQDPRHRTLSVQRPRQEQRTGGNDAPPYPSSSGRDYEHVRRVDDQSARQGREPFRSNAGRHNNRSNVPTSPLSLKGTRDSRDRPRFTRSSSRDHNRPLRGDHCRNRNEHDSRPRMAQPARSSSSHRSSSRDRRRFTPANDLRHCSNDNHRSAPLPQYAPPLRNRYYESGRDFARGGAEKRSVVTSRRSPSASHHGSQHSRGSREYRPIHMHVGSARRDGVDTESLKYDKSTPVQDHKGANHRNHGEESARLRPQGYTARNDSHTGIRNQGDGDHSRAGGRESRWTPPDKVLPNKCHGDMTISSKESWNETNARDWERSSDRREEKAAWRDTHSVLPGRGQSSLQASSSLSSLGDKIGQKWGKTETGIPTEIENQPKIIHSSGCLHHRDMDSTSITMTPETEHSNKPTSVALWDCPAQKGIECKIVLDHSSLDTAKPRPFSLKDVIKDTFSPELTESSAGTESRVALVSVSSSCSLPLVMPMAAVSESPHSILPGEDESLTMMSPTEGIAEGIEEPATIEVKRAREGDKGNSFATDVEDCDDDASDDSSENESSDDETDEEEIMRWAQKMFGITHRPALPVQQEAKQQISVPRREKLSTAVSSSDSESSGSELESDDESSSHNGGCFMKSSSIQPSIPKKEMANRMFKSKAQPVVTEEMQKLAIEEAKRKKDLAKPPTAAELKKILAEESDVSTVSTHWVRRSVRQPSQWALNSPNVRSLIDKLRVNDSDMIVLKMKKYLSDPDTPQVILDAALDALEENSNCQALYIQNFNQGMRDEQVLHLLKVLQLPSCHIWCLNIGETYNVKTKTWKIFAKGLKLTRVTHMYASEHTISSELKDKIRETIRLNRKKHDMHINPENLDVILQCTHCWWNPVNATVLRPYLTKRGYEYILFDKEAQGLQGSSSEAPAGDSKD